MATVDYVMCDCSCWVSNISWCPDIDAQSQNEWEWFLKLMAKTPRELREMGERLIRPLLLVFKRFDFRASPRWRSQRWKAKT